MQKLSLAIYWTIPMFLIGGRFIYDAAGVELPQSLQSSPRIKFMGTQALLFPPLKFLPFAETYALIELQFIQGDKNPFLMPDGSFLYRHSMRMIQLGMIRDFFFQRTDNGSCNELNFLLRSIIEDLPHHFVKIDQLLRRNDVELSFEFTSQNFLDAQTVLNCQLFPGTGEGQQRNWIRLMLKLPVRKIRLPEQQYKILEIDNVEFIFIHTNKVCHADSLTQARLSLPYYVPPVVLAHGNMIYRIGHLLQKSIPGLLECTAVYCLITEDLIQALLPDLCFSSIQSNDSIERIQKLCRIGCFDLSEEGLKKVNDGDAKVVQDGDILYISRIVHPILLTCTNESKNTEIEAPFGGVLQVKLPCGCELHYQNRLLAFRFLSTFQCCSETSDLDYFQLLPSELLSLTETSNLTRVEMESKVYYKVSGVLMSTEAILATIEEYKTRKTEWWRWENLTEFFNLLEPPYWLKCAVVGFYAVYAFLWVISLCIRRYVPQFYLRALPVARQRRPQRA